MLIQLTSFTMTVHAGFIPHRFIRNWILYVLAKDSVSVGCLFVCFFFFFFFCFSVCLNVLFA